MKPFALAILLAIAAAPLHAADPITIENEHLRAVIDVDHGGRVIALTDKRTNIGYTADPDSAAGAGLLNDRLWGQRQVRGLPRMAYDVVSRTADSVTLTVMINTRSEGAFLIDKTIALSVGRASLVADYAVSNLSTGNWEGHLWISNLLRPDTKGDEKVTFSFPTGYSSPGMDRNITVPSRRAVDYLPGIERTANVWLSNPRSGWLAVRRDDGAGAAIIADRGYIDWIYSHQPNGVAGGEKLATSEIMFGPLLLKPSDNDEARDKLGIPPMVGNPDPGKPFRTRLEIMPIPPAAGQIVDARDGVVTLADWRDAAVTFTAIASTPQPLDAIIAARAMATQQPLASAAWKAQLKPGATSSITLPLAAPLKGSRVATITRADGYVMTLPTFANDTDALHYEEPAPVATKTDYQPQIDMPEIDDGPTTAHVAWLKPLPRKPRLLLILTDRSRRDLPELLQRFDADVDTAVVAHPHYFTYHSSPVATDPHRVLPHLLAKEHDAIIIGGGLYFSILPEKDRATILEKVKAGAGLVYLSPHAGDSLFANSTFSGTTVDELIGGEPLTNKTQHLIRGIPTQHIPVFREWKSLADHIAITHCGKGTVINYDVPIWPYKRSYLVRQTLRPFTTQQQQAGVEFPFIEYHWLLTLKMIAHAAGVELADVDVRLNSDLTASLTLANLAHDVTAHATWLNRQGQTIATAAQPVAAGATAVTLAPKSPRDVLPGAALVQVILRDAKGYARAAAAASTTIARKPVVTSMRTLRFGHQVGDPVRGEAVIAGQLPKGATLNLRVTDMRGRLIAEQSHTLAAQPTEPAATRDANLAPNGAFELDKPGDITLPAGWAKTNGSAPMTIINSSHPHGSGTQTLRINTSENAHTGGVHSPYIPVDPRKPLTVSGWVKAAGKQIPGAGGYLGVHWYDTDRKPIALRKTPRHNYVYVFSAMRDDQWVQRTATFTPVNAPADEYAHNQLPFNAAYFELRAFVLEYPAAVEFDDIRAEQPRDEGALSPDTPAKNIVRFQLRPSTTLTQLNRIDASLLDADGSTLDMAWCEYTVDLPTPDDIVFQVWGPNNPPGTVSGELEINAIVDSGFDYATVNASSAPPHEVRDYGLALMRRGLRMMPMTLMRIGTIQKDMADPVRTPCLTDPTYRRHQGAQLERYTRALHELYPPAYFNGDENSLGSYSKPHDFCQSPTCLARYRGWLEDKYRSIGKLNSAWGENFASFDDVRPITLAQARESGQFAGWIAHRAYMPSVLADFYAFMHLAVKQGRPNASLATSGMGTPSLNNGFDWPQLMPHLNHGILYARQHMHTFRSELYRSFMQPGAKIGTWTGYGASQRFVRDSFWWEVTSGLYAPAYYASLEYLCTFGMGQSDDAKAVAQDIAEIKSGIGKLIMGATRTPDRIAIYHSYLSAVALESVHQRDGSEVDFKAYYAALDGYTQLLHELGYQFTMVDRADLDAGRVTHADYDVLLMPLAHALGDDAIDHAQQFVASGGVIVADPAFGYLSDSGAHAVGRDVSTWLGATAQDQAFTWVNDQRPAIARHGKGHVITVAAPIWDYAQQRGEGRERIMRDNVAAAFAAVGVQPAINITGDQAIGNALWNGEIARFSLGEGQLVSIRRNADSTGSAKLAGQAMRITWPDAAHVYDARRGQYLGEQSEWSGDVDMGDFVLLARLPHKVGNLTATAAFDRVAPGGVVAVAASIACNERLALHLSVFAPDGQELKHLAQNQWLSSGSATFNIPIALNDALGKWRATVRDVTSGQTAEVTWQVGE